MSDFQDKITGATPQPGQSDAVDTACWRELQDKITGTPPRRGDARGPGTLQVEYRLTLEDVLTFSRYHWKHWGKRPGQPGHIGWLGPIMLGLIGFGGLAKFLGDSASFPTTLVDFLSLLPFLVFAFIPCLWVFSLLFGGMIRDLRLRRQFYANPRYSDRRVLAISEEGVTGGDQTATMTICWHAVVRIIEDGPRAYFYINAGEAFVLPKRSFADELQFEQFVDTARRYHEEARRFVRTEGQA